MPKKKWIILIVLMVGFLLLLSLISGEKPVKIEASTFYSQLTQGKIAQVVIKNEVVTSGEYKTGKKFETYCSLALYPNLGELFNSQGVMVNQASSGGSWIGLLSMLPLLLIFVFVFFSMRRATSGAGGLFSFGKSRARLFTGQTVPTTFDDVAGAEEAKQELQEVIDFLKGFETFRALGARVPRGVLLVGSPGTGKTLMARAVAGEAGVPFFFISGSEFEEIFVGVGASRVRDLFDQAKAAAPSIIFIDEIDAVGQRRGVVFSDGAGQTLNQILSAMDGFDVNTNVIVLAATNRPEVLDPALLRPGRFDRRVIFDRPDIAGRKAILEVHAKGKPFDSSLDLETIAKQTPGFSGADLANLINEAAILTGRRKKKLIGMAELEESVDKVIAGPERKSKKISPKEKKIIAYHEAGHALVARKLPNADPVHKISIVARGLMGGYTRLLPTEDRNLVTRSQFEDMLATLLGGYIAEELIFGESSTGPENDLERATKISYQMVTEYGMSRKLGPRTFGQRERLIFLGQETEKRNYSEETAQKIDEEVNRFIGVARRKAKKILKENSPKLEQIAERLLSEETIEGEALEKLFNEPVNN